MVVGGDDEKLAGDIRSGSLSHPAQLWPAGQAFWPPLLQHLPLNPETPDIIHEGLNKL